MTGTGNIASFTTTNSSNIPISSLFTVRAYSNSCYSTPVLFSINVNPIPSVNDIADLNVCGNQVIGPVVFMGSPLAGTLYQWTNSNPSIGLAASGVGTIAAFNAANNFNTTITAFITVTPLSNTCVGIQKQFSITVRPTPTIDPIPDRVFCTQATSSSILFAGSTIPGSIYQWSHDNAAIGLSIMSGEVSVPSFTCANLSNTRISSRFMVTPFSNGCSGVPAVFSITVDPIPRLDQVQDVVICGDRKIEGIIFTGSPIAGTVFNWTNNNSSIGLANSGVGNIVAFTASNNSTVPIAAQITVVPFSNTCSGSPVSFSITIKPTPVADPIPNQVLCANYPTAPVVFSGSAIPGTLYNWTNSFSAIGLAPSGTGNIASFNATSSYNIPVSSNITVIPFTNGCHGDPTSFLITVNPIPTVNPLTSQIVCADQQVGTIVFSGSIMGGTVYEWTNNNSAVGLGTTGIGNIPAFTAVNTSNITISSLISVTPISNACRGVTESMILTVKPTPIVHTVSNYAYCGGTLTQPIIFDGSVIQNTLYNWVQTNVNTGLSAISGTGNIPAFTTLNSSNIPVNSLVTVTPFTNGCTGPSKSFNILVNPAPSINPVSDIVSCGNGMISAINFSGSIVPSTEYRWTNDNLSIGLPSSGIGSIAAFTATNNFSVPVVARITVTPFSNNCQGLPISFSITIKPTPSINSISNQVACANTLTQPVIFDGSTISGTQYQWSSTLNTIGLGTSAGTGNIPAFTATTVSNIPVTARFTVTPISNSCAGSPTFFDITVNPIPSVNTVPDIIQCGLISTQPIVFQGSGVPSTIYEWTNNNVSIGIPAAGTGTIQPFTATNSANQLISAQIQVTPFSNNCAGSPKQFNIKIKPVPKVDTISNQILCAGQSTTGVLFSGSAIANTQYNWTATNGLTGIPTLTGSGFIPAFTTVNNTNVTVSNLITVTPFTNGCSSLPITFQYIVHPTPNIQPVADLITCGSRQLGPILFNGSNVAGTLYSWTNVNSAIGIPAAGIGNIEPFTPMNVSTAPLASVITVTPISNTCVGASISFSVVIKPIPVMTSLLPQIVCNQTRTAPILFASSLSNTTYTWSNSDPATGLPFTTGSGNIPAFTATNSSPLPISSQFTIQPLADGCNGLAQTVTITVTPTPVLSSSLLPTGICNGGVFSYTATTATPGTNFIWQRNATPAINGNTSSGGFTANIQELLTSTNSQSMSIFYTIDMTAAGCTNTQSITVTLSPAAVLAGLPVPTSVCSGSIFSYTTQTTTPNTLITWRRDQIPGISNPTNTGVSIISEILNNTTIQPISVRYEVTLTSGGCSNPQSITTVILPLPAIANQTLTTCSGVLIEFTPVNTVENTLLTWSLPLTTPASSITGMQGNSTPKNIFSQTLISNTTQVALATYSVQTRANNCFGNAFSLTVQILPSPVFNSVTLTPVCSGSTFTYVPIGSASNSTFTWSLPDQRPKNSLTGATTGLNQPVFSQTLVALNTIRDTAIYSVQPISGNCTGAPFSITIIVNPVALVTDKTDTVCSGSRYTYLPENVPAGSDFIWEIPEIIPLGAVSGTQQQITPAAIFSQLPVNLTQQMATLRYRIYAISDNCTSQPFQLQLVVTRPIPVIAQQYRQTCSGIQVDLTPRNVPTGITYSWDVPIIQNNSGVTGMSGSSSNVPVIQQQLINRSTTRETVDYTIYPYRDNCIGEPFIGTVAIVPLPKVSINGPGALCQNVNDTLQFNFNGVGPWRFRFDDNGNTGSRSLIRSNPYTLILPPTGTSAIGGTRNIKIYQVEDSACANPNDTVYVTQRIDRLPVGRILSLRGNYICNNTLDTLFVITADSVNYQWYWNGNILPTATQDSISTNWPGVYQVRLTNGSGCSDTAIAPVRLLSVSRPVVKFRFDYSCINTPIRFFNQTDSLKSGPLSWNWDFGNGQTDTTFNTQSSYQVPGIYHVILTAKQKNCDAFPATILDSVIQIVQPIDRVDLPTISAYKNVNKVITGRDLPGYIYKWSPSFGLRRTDSASTTFNYSINMKYGISMTSKEGCVTTDSLFIRVFNDKLVEIFVPKSFTPNGDGVNDKIFAYTAGIREFKHFKIINRNGKQLFETRNIDQGWDGVYNGTPQPMSIYFWVAEGIADDGSVVQRSGQFLLIR
jgi:gliding motility-associated-like protein